MAQPRTSQQDRGRRQLPAHHRARPEARERTCAAHWHGVAQPLHHLVCLPAHPAVSDAERLLLLRDARRHGQPRVARTEETGQPRHPLHARGEERAFPQRHLLSRAPYGREHRSRQLPHPLVLAEARHQGVEGTGAAVHRCLQHEGYHHSYSYTYARPQQALCGTGTARRDDQRARHRLRPLLQPGVGGAHLRQVEE